MFHSAFWIIIIHCTKPSEYVRLPLLMLQNVLNAGFKDTSLTATWMALQIVWRPVTVITFLLHAALQGLPDWPLLTFCTLLPFWNFLHGLVIVLHVNDGVPGSATFSTFHYSLTIHFHCLNSNCSDDSVMLICHLSPF